MHNSQPAERNRAPDWMTCVTWQTWCDSFQWSVMEFPHHGNLHESKSETWFHQAEPERYTSRVEAPGLHILHLWGQAWNMPVLYWILISSRTVMHWRESRGGLLAGSQVSTIGVQASPLCYTSFTLNRWRNADASVDWPSCIKFWTNVLRCRWISWIWFCVIDLSEDPLLNKDLRYLVVLLLSFRNPLPQELLLSGTHNQTPSSHWLRYHPSEAICLLHHARRCAPSIAEISIRRLAIIIQIQGIAKQWLMTMTLVMMSAILITYWGGEGLRHCDILMETGDYFPYPDPPQTPPWHGLAEVLN